ncbi:MAG TPA: heat-inducible transcriptional repressor HrcA [Rhodothermales bacterium]|nr:heat-inducible transcriptional repressor HrcA [Rhodothermales bacterium]
MPVSNQPYNPWSGEHPLTEREREILRLVVKSFILTADPVGSRFLSKQFQIGLSAASIRHTMSDLEDLGYLDHPYTSAGRIPTELGYRKFVNELMEAAELTPGEKQMLRSEIERLVGDTDDLLWKSSRILGRLSNLLAVALMPKLSTGVLDRLEVVPLSSNRAMFVVSMRGGLVKTIMLELDSGLNREDLDQVVPILNERLSGLTLEEIRQTYVPRLRDLDVDRNGIVRLVLDEAPMLFSEQAEGKRVRYGGAKNILLQPEFQAPAEFRNLMEIVEDENFVVQLLEERRVQTEDQVGRAVISIGSENSDEKADKCSLVTARYKMGDSVGTIGVLGPMRMDYARAVSLVEAMAAVLSTASEEES